MGVCWKIWWVLFMVYLRHVYVVVYGVVTMKISWSYINNIHQDSIYTVINDWQEVCFFLYFLMSVQAPGYLLNWDEKKQPSNLRCSWYPDWYSCCQPLLESDSCTGTTGWHCLETCCQATGTLGWATSGSTSGSTSGCMTLSQWLILCPRALSNIATKQDLVLGIPSQQFPSEAHGRCQPTIDPQIQWRVVDIPCKSKTP